MVVGFECYNIFKKYIIVCCNFEREIPYRSPLFEEYLYFYFIFYLGDQHFTLPIYMGT